MTEEEKRFKAMVQEAMQEIFKQGLPVCAIEGYKLSELQKRVDKNERAIEGKDGLTVTVAGLVKDVAEIKADMSSISDSVKVTQSDAREALNMLRQQKASQSWWKDKILPALTIAVITAVSTALFTLIILHFAELAGTAP